MQMAHENKIFLWYEYRKTCQNILFKYSLKKCEVDNCSYKYLQSSLNNFNHFYTRKRPFAGPEILKYFNILKFYSNIVYLTE